MSEHAAFLIRPEPSEVPGVAFLFPESPHRRNLSSYLFFKARYGANPGAYGLEQHTALVELLRGNPDSIPVKNEASFFQLLQDKDARLRALRTAFSPLEKKLLEAELDHPDRLRLLDANGIPLTIKEDDNVLYQAIPVDGMEGAKRALDGGVSTNTLAQITDMAINAWARQSEYIPGAGGLPGRMRSEGAHYSLGVIEDGRYTPLVTILSDQYIADQYASRA